MANHFLQNADAIECKKPQPSSSKTVWPDTWAANKTARHAFSETCIAVSTLSWRWVPGFRCSDAGAGFLESAFALTDPRQIWQARWTTQRSRNEDRNMDPISGPENGTACRGTDSRYPGTRSQNKDQNLGPKCGPRFRVFVRGGCQGKGDRGVSTQQSILKVNCHNSRYDETAYVQTPDSWLLM